MLFLAGFWEGVGNFFLGLIRIAVMGIIYGIYWLISAFYNLFIYMTKINLLSGNNESLVSDIYNRIQVILAVVMVFYVTLEFVKYIVNPDTFSDKEKGGGGLLKRVLVVIVLMAFTPRIFGIAYDLQGRIINSEVIPKVLIKDYNSLDYDRDAGGEFSSNLLSLFYKPYKAKNGMSPQGNCEDGRTPQKVVDDNLEELANDGDITSPTYCIDTTGDDLNLGNGKVKNSPFLIEMGLGGIFPIALGLFMVWVLVNYCAEAGRVIIQFVFLQIIAPIPILSYLAPGKDGMFQKWTKQCVTTYLDMFIRLFIMYLVMLLSSVLLKFDYSEVLGGVQSEAGTGMGVFIILFLIIGLLLFALKAPKMIKELLPSGSNAASGDYGIGWKSTKDRFRTPTRVAGAAAGALATGTLGLAHRGFQGIRGFKNKKAKNLSEAEKNGKSKFGAYAKTYGSTAWNVLRGAAGGGVSGVVRGAYNGGKSGNVIKNVGSGLKNQTTANVRYGNIVENEYTIGHRIVDTTRNILQMKTRVEKIEKEKVKIEERSKQLTSIKTLNDKMRERAEKKLTENGHEAINAAEAELNYWMEKSKKVVKYENESEAKAAYIEAQQRAADSVIKQNFCDASGNVNYAAYNEAIERAKKSVDKDDYLSKAAADKLFGEKIEAANKALKNAKDTAINKWIDEQFAKPDGDGAIKGMKEEQLANVRAYNRNASPNLQIDTSEYEDLKAEDFDNYVKGEKVSGQITKDNVAISELSGQQQEIKKEIEGSGVAGEGAKK